MKKVIFIGNRYKVLEKIRNNKFLELVDVYTVENSLLEDQLIKYGVDYRLINKRCFEETIEKIKNTKYDILVSNGCPFRLPISDLATDKQKFINVHPSCLPELRGMHSINYTLLSSIDYFGATVHYMDNNFDTGNIIAQKKVPLTDDIDLGLLYKLSFELEAETFQEAFEILHANNYEYDGIRQSGRGYSYKRSLEDMTLDVQAMDAKEILKKIRAFGIKSQGVILKVEDQTYRIFDAQEITNPYIIEKYEPCSAGRIIFHYENSFLLKVKDGILKIKYYNLVQ